MKKKVKVCLAIVLSIALMVSYIATCNINAFAQKSSSITWSYDEETETLTISGTGKIPDYGIDNSPYAEIKDTIKHVVINEGIVEIGDSALWEMYSCQSLSFPESLYTIGDYGAADMAITSLYIPKNVANIGVGLCKKDNDLISLEVDPENWVFYSENNCLIRKEDKTLEAATPNSIIPSDVTRINHCAFSLLEIPDIVNIPDSVKTIEHSAFELCYIKTLNIGSNVSYIGKYNFCETRIDNINISEKNNYVSLKNHCLIINDNEVIAYEYTGKNVEEVDIEIPEGVERISQVPSSRFDVNKMIIPKTVNTFGICSFYVKYTIKELDIYSEEAPTLELNALYDCEFINGIHVLKNAKGYDKEPWTNHEIYYDLGSDDPQPLPEEYDRREDLYFSFINSHHDLGYNDDYWIPLSAYQIWYSDSQAEVFRRNDGPFSGNCFGFSSASDLLYNSTESGIGVKDFGSNNKKICNLKTTDTSKILGNGTTVRYLLEALQVSQYKAIVQNAYSSGSNQLNTNALMAINDLKNRNCKPYVLAVFGPNNVGHAIVGYNVISVSDTEDHLMVYDCNYGNRPRYVCLYKSGGKYTGWKYMINDYIECSTNVSSSKLCFLDFDLINELWNQRKQPTYNLVEVERKAAIDITDESGEVVAKIRDGELKSYDESILPVIPLTIDNPSENLLFYVKEKGAYSFTTVSDCAYSINVAGNECTTGIDVDSKKNGNIEVDFGSDSADSVTVSNNISYTVTFYKNGKVISSQSSDFNKEENTDLSNADVTNIKSAIYSGNAVTQAPIVKLNNKVLTINKDYIISYVKNINAGTAKMVITGIGKYSGSVSKSFVIASKKITPQITLSASNFEYNGKNKKPKVIVKYKNKILDQTDYKVLYSKESRNIGTYKVTVVLKGNYKGNISKTYRIVPQKSQVINVSTQANDKVKIKWRKVSRQIDGYEVQISTTNTFPKGKNTYIRNIPGRNNTNKCFTLSKSNKKYYVRVRTYKIVKGKKVYSLWSKCKTIKMN